MSFLPVVIPGDWYFVALCPNCKKQRAIGPAPPPDAHAHVKSWPHILTCDCGKQSPIPAEKIQRLQAAQVPGPTPGPSVVFRLPSGT
jgi:hypothetical protein